MCRTGNYGQNRFAQKGVELQMNAINYWKAKKSYSYSCMLCCSHGVGAIECAHCPIREAFLTNCEIFKDYIPKSEEDFIQKERELL